MILLNSEGCARPVRIVAKSSLPTETAFSIFSSASRRVSSITMTPSPCVCRLYSRGSPTEPGHVTGIVSRTLRPTDIDDGFDVGGDQGADLLAPDRPGDAVIHIEAEHHNRQVVVHAEAEGGRIGHIESLPQHFCVGDGDISARVRMRVRVGLVNAVNPTLTHEQPVTTDFQGALGGH